MLEEVLYQKFKERILSDTEFMAKIFNNSKYFTTKKDKIFEKLDKAVTEMTLGEDYNGIGGIECEVLAKIEGYEGDDNCFHWVRAEYYGSLYKNDYNFTDGKGHSWFTSEVEGVRFQSCEWATRLSQEEIDMVLSSVKV